MTQSRGENDGARSTANVRRRGAVNALPESVPRGAATEVRRALREREKREGIVSGSAHFRSVRKLADPLDNVRGPW